MKQLCFTELKAMEQKKKHNTFPLLLDTLFVLQETMPKSWVLPLTSQAYLGLSSHLVEKLGQVCKFRAIYMDLCFAVDIQNMNRSIHHISMRGSNKRALQTTALVSHQITCLLTFHSSSGPIFSM